eukprot:1156647-Pelagomonas_calceolata.AAC.19
MQILIAGLVNTPHNTPESSRRDVRSLGLEMLTVSMSALMQVQYIPVSEWSKRRSATPSEFNIRPSSAAMRSSHCEY